MKRPLLNVLFSAGILLTAQAGELDLPKVIHYGLKVQFLLKEQFVRVDAALTIRNVTQSSNQEIPFLLYRLLSIQRITDGFGSPLGFEQNVVQFS